MIDSNEIATYEKPHIKYDNFGRIIEQKHGRFTTQYSYLKVKDKNCNLIENVVNKEDGIVKDELVYKYNSNGNIVEICENAEKIIEYKYNKHFWLIREDNKLFNKTFIYEYDLQGKVIRKIEYNYSIKNEKELRPIFINNFGYKDINGCKKLQYFNEEVIRYDNNKPVIYRGEKITWSKIGQLESLGDFALFKYNLNGLRISKTFNNVKTNYLYENDKIILQDNGIKMCFYYGNNDVIAFTLKDEDSVPKYYVYKKNIQGDIVGIYSNSTQIVKYVYDYYGNQKIFVLVNGKFADIVSNSIIKRDSTTKEYITIAELNPFRFRGCYYDVETGLYYENGKYYDPNLGKFIDE